VMARRRGRKHSVVVYALYRSIPIVSFTSLKAGRCICVRRPLSSSKRSPGRGELLSQTGSAETGLRRRH